MATRGHKCKQCIAESSSQTLIAESASNGSSSINGQGLINRLVDIMLNFIKNTNIFSRMDMTKSDVVPGFNLEDAEQSSERCSPGSNYLLNFGKIKAMEAIWYKGLQTMMFMRDE